jgi:hypothetical protein
MIGLIYHFVFFLFAWEKELDKCWSMYNRIWKKGAMYSSVFIRNLRSQEEMSLKYTKKQKNSLGNLPTHSQFLSKHIYIYMTLSLVITIYPALLSHHEQNNTLSCKKNRIISSLSIVIVILKCNKRWHVPLIS